MKTRDLRQLNRPPGRLKGLGTAALLALAACRPTSAAPPPPPRPAALAPAVPVADAARHEVAPSPPPAARRDDPEPDDYLADPAAIVGRFGLTGAGDVSRSLGTAQNGALQGGVPLVDSSALRVLPHTRERGFFYGTAELVGLLHRSAAAVAEAHPGSRLRIGNLSRQSGGDIGPSVSHNSGRDADVLFYAYDRLGSEAEPTPFAHFDETCVVDAPAQDAGRFEFDTARNWALVRHWLTDPDVLVQWIFVSVPLRNRLLDHALRVGEPESLRRRASRVLVQPRDSSPHADHFHLRIACPAQDRPACIDGGGVASQAREAQIDALLQMYHHGTPAEQRYARELLTLPPGGEDAELPPIEGED